jgi:hypothetical protein
MKLYDYYQYDSVDKYGSPVLSEDPKDHIRMAINITSQSIQDNINYSGASYIGLTTTLVDDSYVIEYGNEYLKVLYVNPKGRLKQVFMAKL